MTVQECYIELTVFQCTMQVTGQGNEFVLARCCVHLKGTDFSNFYKGVQLVSAVH